MQKLSNHRYTKNKSKNIYVLTYLPSGHKEEKSVN